MSLTTEQQINIGRICGLLASNELEGGKKHGGLIDTRLPSLIHRVHTALRWLYEYDPTHDDLARIGNYLISICRHQAKAEYKLSIASGGTIAGLTPTAVSSIFPIVIDSSNFSSATEYNDTRIVGKSLTIDIKEIPTTLIPGVDFAYTATGFQILIDGFDATANDYHLRIWEATAGQNPTAAGSSTLISWYYGDTDYYSDLIANNDTVPYNGTSSGTIGNPISVTFPSGASDPSGKYLVFKVASSQTDKSTWENTGTLNTGNIPDSVFRELISFGGYDYYCTRIAYVFDPSFLTMVLT